MDALDIITYGHKDVLRAVDGLDELEWNVNGVTTHWSIKDTLAHLTSYECLLEDALNSVLNPSRPTPYINAMNNDREGFNDAQVSARSSKKAQEILAEYTDTYNRVLALVQRAGAEKLREVGVIPWYGEKYSLDDFIVYANYAHKREHVALIKSFRKRVLKNE